MDKRDNMTDKRDFNLKKLDETRDLQNMTMMKLR
jgi:hypothetical protein